MKTSKRSNIFFSPCAILFLLLLSMAAFAQPATCTATIGNPANGASHFINVSWAAVGGATAYELEVSDNGSSNWTNIYTGTALTFSHNTGNLANTPYYYRVRSVSGSPSAYTNATQFPVYTACDAPALPQLINATNSTLSILLPAETPVANPANTTYSIFCTTTSQYVQANGSLGANEVFQTRAAWATVIVTGLSANTNYCFYSKARNVDGNIQTAPGNTLLATETFTTNANFSTQSVSGPTNRFWSPSSCTTGGLIYSNSQGCSPGSVGFNGTFNNFFGCFLRSPTIDCSGNNNVTLTFDVTHSFSASTPNNRMRIYIFADGAYINNTITALTINGNNALASFGINGQGISYTELRTCGAVVVTFNIASVSDKSNISFWLEPNCGYNNSQPFFTWIDNVGIAGSSNATACFSTTSCTSPVLQSNPVNTAACAGNNAAFSVNVTGNVSGYQWQESTNGGGSFSNINNGGIYSNATTATLNLTGVSIANNAYQYRCIITPACGNIITSTAATLTLNTVPTQTAAINGEDTVCVGSTFNYSVSAINNATSYTWTLPQGVNAVGSNTGNTIQLSFGNNAQSGALQVAAKNNCGTGAASTAFNIIVNDVPDMPVAINGNNSVCEGSNNTYTINAVANADTYVWTFPATWTNVNTNGTNAQAVAVSSGNISVAASNSCGNSMPATLNVVVSTLPVAPDTILLSTDTACLGDIVTVNVLPSPAAGTNYNYVTAWQITDTINSNTIVLQAGINATSISVTASNGCGTSSSVSKDINSIALNVEYNFTGNPVCNNAAPFALTGGTPASGIYSGIGLNANGVFSPAAAGAGEQIITYTLEENGCIFSDTALIIVEVCTDISNSLDESILVYPNPFSDKIFISSRPMQSIKLYDSVGKLVFQQDNHEISGNVILLHHLSSGSYTLLVTNQHQQIKRFNVVKM